jgi:hypothetical protein
MAALEAVDGYRRSATAPADLLDLAGAVFRAQAEGAAELTAAVAVAGVPRGWARRAVERLAVAVAGHSPRPAEGLLTLHRILPDTDEAELWAAARGDGEALGAFGSRSGLPPAVALFVLRHALEPGFAAMHPRPEGAPGPLPARRRCPACGGLPAAAKHTAPDGHRFLRCSICGCEWAYPRLVCPACGETDQQRLGALYLSGDEGHRAYTCAICRRYIKISDERALSRGVHLPLEAMVTLYLDELARERGFQPIADAGDGAAPLGPSTYVRQ